MSQEGFKKPSISKSACIRAACAKARGELGMWVGVGEDGRRTNYGNRREMEKRAREE